LILLGKNRKYTNTVAEGKILPNIKEVFQIGLTFGLVVLGWIFFRAENITHAWSYISGIFSASLLSIKIPFIIDPQVKYLVFFIPVFILTEWIGRNNRYALEKLLLGRKSCIRHLFYFVLALFVICFSLMGKTQEFIYFQF
jgi:hypothetical protein